MNEMNSDLLVDLYAAGELPEELEQALLADSCGKPELMNDMATLRHTVDLLKNCPVPAFDERVSGSILRKIAAAGAQPNSYSQEPQVYQLHLAIQG